MPGWASGEVWSERIATRLLVVRADGVVDEIVDRAVDLMVWSDTYWSAITSRPASPSSLRPAVMNERYTPSNALR